MIGTSETTLVAADLFSGAGGLTVGLKQAGFKVATAVESEQHAFATYKANHPEVSALKQNIQTVTGKALKRLAGGSIHLLAGCPPCQGFSTLTNPMKKSDPRNKLVKEMARLVKEVRPIAVMMENVPGLADRGAYLLRELVKTLKEAGYVVNYEVLQLADYGVPQNRRRLVLLAGKGFEIKMPAPTHDRLGANGLPTWKTLADAIGDLGKAVLLSEANKAGGPSRFNWHVVRSLSEDNQARIKASLPGSSRAALPKDLRPACHQESDKGYTNVYGRMTWEQLPVTITGGCTTLSKGRFGHPEQLRTISVREAARIQTFPDTYIFDTPYMEYVCNMIGNALPCDFATLVSSHVKVAIAEHLKATDRRRKSRKRTANASVQARSRKQVRA